MSDTVTELENRIRTLEAYIEGHYADINALEDELAELREQLPDTHRVEIDMPGTSAGATTNSSAFVPWVLNSNKS